MPLWVEAIQKVKRGRRYVRNSDKILSRRSLLDIDVHSILHRQREGYLVGNVLTWHQNEFVASYKRCDDYERLECGKVLSCGKVCINNQRHSHFRYIVFYLGRYVDHH